MSSRIPRDSWFWLQAKLVSERSTCSRLHVGALLVRDNRVISQGYNGVPSGMPHCNHPQSDNEPCTLAVHAEANALIIAAKYGIATEGTHLWVTHMPCLNCAKLIINAGVERVYYEKPYRDDSGVQLLALARVFVLTVEPL